MTAIEPSVNETRSGFLVRAVEWLRAGYPSGVPRQDYVVLLGLLRRSLTEVEVGQIAATLADGVQDAGRITVDDIQAMIREATLDAPSPQDVARVSARLAAAGWPLAGPPSD